MRIYQKNIIIMQEINLRIFKFIFYTNYKLKKTHVKIKIFPKFNVCIFDFQFSYHKINLTIKLHRIFFLKFLWVAIQCR